MALGNITENTKEIKSQVESIVNDNLDYYKLLGFKTAAKSATSLAKLLVVGLFVVLVIFFLAMAGGFAFSEYLGSNTYGFLAMAGVLFVLLLFIIALRKFLFDRPVLRKLSKIINKTSQV